MKSIRSMKSIKWMQGIKTMSKQNWQNLNLLTKLVPVARKSMSSVPIDIFRYENYDFDVRFRQKPYIWAVFEDVRKKCSKNMKIRFSRNRPKIILNWSKNRNLMFFDVLLFAIFCHFLAPGGQLISHGVVGRTWSRARAWRAATDEVIQFLKMLITR